MALRAAAAALLLVSGLLTACAAPPQVADPPPVPSPAVTTDPTPRPYAGPLFLTAEQIRSDTDRTTGAAGRVVDCRTRITGHRDDPSVGHEGAAARSPQLALDVGFGEGFFDTTTKVFALERKEAERALFVHRVGGVVKQAAIVHRGPVRDRDGTVGWYVEARARCDWAELPDDLQSFFGWEPQIWIGPDGQRAPTYDVVSAPGPEHCDWQSMTFLNLPNEAVYVRNPQPGLVDDYFEEPFRTGVALPDDAVDSGYQRDGRRLWLSADRRRAYVGQPGDVEVWPRTSQPLLCA